jgi:pyruvate/2-oxoglutarate dehydrogenase complex dihydrolipoamide acyltransferase (E2) component
MARIPIEMASLGYDMETGRIAGWSRRVGDLVEIVHEAGAEVPVGETIGYLDGEA